MERALGRESGGPGSSTSSSANCPGKWKRNFVSSFQSLGLSALIFEKGKVDAVPSSSGRFKVAPPPLIFPSLPDRQAGGGHRDESKGQGSLWYRVFSKSFLRLPPRHP